MRAKYASESNPIKRQRLKEQHNRIIEVLKEEGGSEFQLVDRNGRELYSCEMPASVSKDEMVGWAMSEAIASDTKLTNGNFKNKKLRSFNLKGGDFRGSAFNGTVFEHVKFDGSDLSRCNFSNAKLIGCSFKNCNLKDAIFLETENSDCNFTGSNLSGTEFIDSDFSSSYGLAIKTLTLIKNSKME